MFLPRKDFISATVTERHPSSMPKRSWYFLAYMLVWVTMFWMALSGTKSWKKSSAEEVAAIFWAGPEERWESREIQTLLIQLAWVALGSRIEILNWNPLPVGQKCIGMPCILLKSVFTILYCILYAVYQRTRENIQNVIKESELVISIQSWLQ